MDDIAVKIKDLSKKYYIRSHDVSLSITDRLRYKFIKNRIPISENNEFYALQDISLEIKKGEVVGIIGKNGAGKSTLLKILSRVTEPTFGRVEIFGTIASVLEVGVGFHPELTGRENVFLYGTMLGLQKKSIRKIFDKIVDFAEVRQFIDTPVKHYSSGMYMRLAFSVVANIDADILLFDEVLSVGDLAFQIKCREKIQHLASKKHTIIIVSHNINDINSLCSRVVFIDKGKLIESNNTKLTVSGYLDSIHKNCKYALDSEKLNRINEDSNFGFQVKNVEITKNKMTYLDQITVNDSFEICVNIIKNSSVGNLHISLNLSHFGNTFFSTNSFYTKDRNIAICNPGEYKLYAVIPSRFLNASHYNLDLFIIEEQTGSTLSVKDAIVFEILVDKEEVKNKIYNENKAFYGPIYVSLQWLECYKKTDNG